MLMVVGWRQGTQGLEQQRLLLGFTCDNKSAWQICAKGEAEGEAEPGGLKRWEQHMTVLHRINKLRCIQRSSLIRVQKNTRMRREGRAHDHRHQHGGFLSVLSAAGEANGQS